VNELDDRVNQLDTEQRVRRVGVEALERELHGEATDVVDISLYVKGRMIATTTDSATVQRIMAILTGLGG
jgi:hypothetical protein